MMIGFWILVFLFVAGLWWFGRSNGWKRRCECATTPEGRKSNERNRRLTRGDSHDLSAPWPRE